MKTITLILITITQVLYNQNFANTSNTIKTKVNLVTVYTEGAQVSRTKTISLKQGENTLRFTELEQAINTNSIQLFSLSKNDNFTVVSTRSLQEEIAKPNVKKIIQKIEDSLTIVNRKITLLNLEINNFNQEKNLILTHKKIGDKDEISFVTRLADLAQFYRENINEIDRSIFNLELKKEKYNTLKKLLNDRMNKHSQKEYINLIEAKVYANKPIETKFKLTYLVTNAGWTPFYEVKSEGINHPLQVACKATIHQNTGTNWRNVKLILSTRKPEILHSVPQIHPWVLHFKEKLKTYTQNNQLIDQNAISNAYYPINQPTNLTDQKANPTAYLSQFKNATHKMINKEYSNSLNYTINGKDGIAVVPLDKFEMATEYVYYTVPKYDQNVYLLAKIKQWESYDLIPAFANIFLEGNYLGKLFIDPATIDETLNLMLGKDQDISIKRCKVNQFSNKQRKIIGSTETISMGIEIIVTNKKNKPIDLVIKDQVPVSNTEEIIVTVLDKSKADIEDKTGTLTWHYKLKSKETKQHNIKYEIQKPKQKTIKNF